MLIWSIAIAITIPILKWQKIETTPAQLAIGSLVVKIVIILINVPIVVLLGHTDIAANLNYVWPLVVALVLSAWVFIAKSRLSMVGICIFFVLGAIGAVVILTSFPRALWLGTAAVSAAAGGVVSVVGLVSGIYCLRTWSTSLPNNVKVLEVFE